MSRVFLQKNTQQQFPRYCSQFRNALYCAFREYGISFIRRKDAPYRGYDSLIFYGKTALFRFQFQAFPGYPIYADIRIFLQGLNDLIYVFLPALHLGFYRTIIVVPDPSGDPIMLCQILCPVTEPYSLYSSCKYNMFPYLWHFRYLHKCVYT